MRRWYRAIATSTMDQRGLRESYDGAYKGGYYTSSIAVLVGRRQVTVAEQPLGWCRETGPECLMPPCAPKPRQSAIQHLRERARHRW